MQNKSNNKKGLIQLVILIVGGIFLMSYFDITFKEAWDAFVIAFHNVFPNW